MTTLIEAAALVLGFSISTSFQYEATPVDDKTAILKIGDKDWATIKETSPCAYELVEIKDNEKPRVKINFKKLSSEYSQQRRASGMALSASYELRFHGLSGAGCYKNGVCLPYVSFYVQSDSANWRRLLRAMSFVQSNGCVAELPL